MDGAGGHTAFRFLKNVFGIPAGAPDLTCLEIATRANSKTLHPFFVASSFRPTSTTDTKTGSGQFLGQKVPVWSSGGQCRRLNSCCPTQRSPRRHGSRSSLLACTATLVRSLTRTVCTRSAGTPWSGKEGLREKRFVCTVFRQSEMTESTLNAVFEILSWSLNALLKGTFPGENWHGCADGRGELAGGWRGALCHIRGDWALYTEVFKFPQRNDAQRMCFLCRASSTVCGTSLDTLRARRLAPDSVDPRGILGLIAWCWLGNSSAVGCLHWISAGVCHGGRPAHGGPGSRLTHSRQRVLVVCRCAKVFLEKGHTTRR